MVYQAVEHLALIQVHTDALPYAPVSTRLRTMHDIFDNTHRGVHVAQAIQGAIVAMLIAQQVVFNEKIIEDTEQILGSCRFVSYRWALGRSVFGCVATKSEDILFRLGFQQVIK